MQFPTFDDGAYSRDFIKNLQPGVAHDRAAEAVLGCRVVFDRMHEVEGFPALDDGWRFQQIPRALAAMFKGVRVAGYVNRANGNEVGIVCGTYPKDPDHPRIYDDDGSWEYDPDHDAPFVFRLAVYRKKALR